MEDIMMKIKFNCAVISVVGAFICVNNVHACMEYQDPQNYVVLLGNGRLQLEKTTPRVVLKENIKYCKEFETLREIFNIDVDDITYIDSAAINGLCLGETKIPGSCCISSDEKLTLPMQKISPLVFGKTVFSFKNNS